MGSIPELGIMSDEFVVGSRPCSERFFSGFSRFPPSAKNNISKFKFNLEYTVSFEGVPRELFGVPWVNKLHLHLITFDLWLILKA